MGVQRRQFDMSPEEYKLRASGFWTVEYRVDSMETVATCDLPKLHEAINKVLMDPYERRMFTDNPQRYLAARWGESTAKVYFSGELNKGGNRLAMRITDLEKQMAYYGYADTSTNTILYDKSTRTHIIDSVKEAARKVSAQDPRIKDTGLKLEKKLVRTFPFHKPQHQSLLDALRSEFESWAGQTKRNLFPV